MEKKVEGGIGMGYLYQELVILGDDQCKRNAHLDCELNAHGPSTSPVECIGHWRGFNPASVC